MEAVMSAIIRKIRALTGAVLFSLMVFPLSAPAQNLLNGPESVAYDSLHNRYLVSCWGSGNVVEIDSTGAQSYFKTGLSNLLGNHIYGNTFYTSTASGVLGFDLTTGEEVLRVAIGLVGQIDGLTVDDSGFIYVVDGIRGRIYKINIARQTYTRFVGSGLPPYAQDCIFDREHNRLLVVAWADNPGIQAVSLEDSTVTTIVETDFGRFDGIARDQGGNVYVAVHSPSGRVYKFDPDFLNPPELVSEGHIEPAGLCYNNRDDILAVPNFAANTVDLISMGPTSLDEGPGPLPRSFGLGQNFPNPFNPVTTIRFTLDRSARTNLLIFDRRGRLVRSLAGGERLSAGSHTVVWDGRDALGQTVGSGIYFYRLEAGDHSVTRKMVLLK